ncbi:protease 3 precursor [Clostridium tepidiprofundi DSM 19306]|uniref:Protease 3 n=1 Tax=Clostridium tepidiprofundi DSM 19306 TaxID=1121338 RepID=A0A151B786_9CLOT|nr:pitrilysin family protein [Clostridium tepidiprofundi]KYH35785.1 protease 3 precursor [Clostridium tepidiprofundi DSM 19306]
MYEFFTLDNGLRVVVENIDYVSSISVGLWIENGSRNENKYNNGISHFIEHMLFKGTTNRTAKKIAEEIEDVGGQINAFTGKEATCYYIKVLNTHLELALDILSDMLFNSKLAEEDIEKEKSVIYEEIDMNEDSPEDVLLDLHSKAIWGDDSISLPILGTKETLKKLDRDLLKEYIYSYYIPENSVISICGNFDSNKIIRLVEKYFGNWNSKTKKITKYSKPSILENVFLKEKNIEQLHINIGIPGIEIGNDDIYSLTLLCNILGGGASSILFQKLREELGMCYSIYSYSSSLINTGIVSIYAALNIKYIRDALNIINDELQKFTKGFITDEKLYKAKEQLKGSYILGLESTSSRMFKNGRSVLFLNKVNTPEHVLEKIDNIDINNINSVMDKTLRKGIKNIALVGNNYETVLKALGRDVILYK